MDFDLQDFLSDWEFDPDSNLRHVVDGSGREYIQLRLEQGAFSGILQMELDGRPDSRKPHDYDFALDYYQEKHTILKDQNKEKTFSLNHLQCKELFEESELLYERYSFLLQIADYKRVIRDTEQNMELFRFVNTHAKYKDDADYLERWWPYILRINGTALAMDLVQRESALEALELIKSTIDEICALENRDIEEYQLERESSLEALGDLYKQVEKNRTLSPEETIEKELDDALKSEDYEKAAKIRDIIEATRKEA
ncbi:MAG: UvrB/UvrC motif-containing protein [Lentisphaeria bacterium]|nr:UvrB/UvrC motif-containing protein [Lentisphaeria bacterium]